MDLSHQPVRLCFSELTCARRFPLWICCVDGLGNVNIFFLGWEEERPGFLSSERILKVLDVHIVVKR